MIYNTTLNDVCIYNSSTTLWTAVTEKVYTSDPWDLSPISTQDELDQLTEGSIFEIKDNENIIDMDAFSTISSGLLFAPYANVNSISDVNFGFGEITGQATTDFAPHASFGLQFFFTGTGGSNQEVLFGSSNDPTITINFDDTQQLRSVRFRGSTTSTRYYRNATFVTRLNGAVVQTVNTTVSANTQYHTPTFNQQEIDVLTIAPSNNDDWSGLWDFGIEVNNRGGNFSDGIYRKKANGEIEAYDDLKHIIDIQTIPIAHSQEDVDALPNGTRFELIDSQIPSFTDGFYYKKSDGSIIKSSLFN